MSKLTLYDILPTIEEVIGDGREAVFTPGGVSMRPMIIGGVDEIALVKAEFPLKKYSVPLYKRKNGALILHRVVKVLENGYIIRGDNTFADECGISDNNVIAVISRFKHNGKWHSVNERGYKIYCIIWTFIYPLRKFYNRLKNFLKRCISYLKRHILNK